MNVKEIIISGLVLIVIDFIYLKSNMNYFNQFFYNIQKSPLKARPIGFILTYFLLIISLNYLVISKRESIISAFIIGFLIYGVYELTNYSTFNNWTSYMVILDSIWGGLLFAFTTLISYKILQIIS